MYNNAAVQIQSGEDTLSIPASRQITLKYLFFTFLKIGCVSFGGHMALISLVQKMMADKDETLDHEVILDGITVASLLPGPLAVNVVAYIGYYLKGKVGALVSMLGVLLPACVLMLILSWTYFNYAYKINWTEIMYFVPATVGAIILSTGFQLYKKEISGNYIKTILCLISIVVVSITGSYITTVALILTGAVAGVFIGNNKPGFASMIDKLKTKNGFKANTSYSFIISLFVVNEVLFISNIYKSLGSLILKIAIVFSGISLSLFGGGYVMVPLMQSLLVKDLHWLTSQQFVDAIAFSQATPGPILVSSTFIGFKLAGIPGAIIATVAMFAPSAILMIAVAKAFKKNKDHYLVKDIVAGIKAVVIGLIIASAIRILIEQHLSLTFMLIALAAFTLSLKYKISPVYLIIASISIGVIAKYI